MRALSASLVFALASCSDSYVVVTVAARDGVSGISTLAVTESNGTATHTDSLSFGDHEFPVTFSIDAKGRSGTLGVAIAASGSAGTLLAVGSGATSIDSGALALTLNPADFVVNTDTVGDQFLTDDYETKGYQVAATDGGPWTVTFRDTCTSACQMYARMFDPTGVPLTTTVASSTDAFTLATAATDDTANPAIAAANTATIDVWDFANEASSTHGIACRGISANGTLTANQTTLSTDVADAVIAAPLSTGDFAVAWELGGTTPSIRAVIAKADCTAGTVATVSTTVGTMLGPHRASIASNGAAVLYTWITDSSVHVRAGTPTGTFTGADTTLYTSAAGFTVQQARVTPLGAGFGVAVRVTSNDGTTSGSILMLLTNAAGQLLAGDPVEVSDSTGADFSVGAQGFGIATRASDGAALVSWQQCDDGSAGMCIGHQDVYARLISSAGAVLGDPFEVPTATMGDQTGPSVAGLGSAFAVTWTDESATAPDTMGMAVRARVVYPTGVAAGSAAGQSSAASSPAR